MPSARRRPLSADELMKQLNDNPQYTARVAQADKEQREREENLSRAERPIVDELRAVGIDVTSVWYLPELPERGEDAYPILLKHLRMDHPDRVLGGIARAFTKDVVRRRWRELLTIYLHQPPGEAQDGLAATLSACATRAHYEDLQSVLQDESLGDTRIYFLRPAHRIGNRMSAGTGRALIEGLADHPVLGTESTRILQGRGRND